MGGKKRERREREVDLFSKIGSLTMEVDKSNIRRVGWQTSEQEKLLFQLSPKAVCGRIPLPWRGRNSELLVSRFGVSVGKM